MVKVQQTCLAIDTEEPKKMYPDRDKAAILAMKTSSTDLSLKLRTTAEREGTTEKVLMCTCIRQAFDKVEMMCNHTSSRDWFNFVLLRKLSL